MPVLAARVNGNVALEAQADGTIVARFDGYAQGFGKFGAAAVNRLHELRAGLPLTSIATRKSTCWSAGSREAACWNIATEPPEAIRIGS
jgi:hypothetical protein